jgi:predicted dehydrogenase
MQGKNLRSALDPAIMELVAICDIKPTVKQDVASNAGVRWYSDWRRMMQEQNIEAVLIATPLCNHADIATGCLEAGKHAFCETSMAMDVNSCRQMSQAAQKSRRILHIGYQEYYDPLYWAAYHNIIQAGLLGDIHTVKGTWHSYDSGRVKNAMNDVSFDPRPWGYESEDQLRNWRLYRRYSRGLTVEWGGPLVSLMNWFLGAVPVNVQATGGIYSYKDGRDVNDHVYATLDYPNGRTATLSLIQSNGFEGSYTQFMGTRGTLMIGKDLALLFTEAGSRPATVAVAKQNGSQPLLDSSASRTEEASNHAVLTGGGNVEHGGNLEAFQEELNAFCGAIRTGAPLRCDVTHAYDVARTCFAIDAAIEQKMRVRLPSLAVNNHVGIDDMAASESQYV